jgi:hypothetical protein
MAPVALPFPQNADGTSNSEASHVRLTTRMSRMYMPPEPDVHTPGTGKPTFKWFSSAILGF